MKYQIILQLSVSVLYLENESNVMTIHNLIGRKAVLRKGFFVLFFQEPRSRPPLQRLNSASCVLDRYGQRVTVLSKPQRTTRGESMFFDEEGKKSFIDLFESLSVL